MIQEKTKIEKQLRDSMQSFKMKSLKASKPVAPTINRRLGGGLAAVIAKKMAAKVIEFNKQEKSEYRRKPDVDDSDYDSESEGDEEESEDDENSDEAFEKEFHIGKGFDYDDEIDLSEITENDVTE